MDGKNVLSVDRKMDRGGLAQLYQDGHPSACDGRLVDAWPVGSSASEQWLGAGPQRVQGRTIRPGPLSELDS